MSGNGELLKCLSLFSGIGGFDLALTNLGHEIVGACEIDQHARRIYARHFPNVHIHEDATKINPHHLPHIDCIAAGFPCQSFSIAGNRRGFEDTRGTLFFEIARIAKEKRPRYLLLENVKGLLSHEGGATIRTMYQTLDELGYDTQSCIVNTKNFLPQNRERIFIIATLRGEPSREVFPLSRDDSKTDKQVLTVHKSTKSNHFPSIKIVTKDHGKIRITKDCSNAIDANYWKGPDNHGQRTLIQIGNVDTKGHNSKWGRVYDPDGLSVAITSQGGGTGTKTGLYMIAADRSRNLANKGRNLESPKPYSNSLTSVAKDNLVIPVLTPDRLNKKQNGRQLKTDGEPSYTLTAQDKHGIYDGKRIRRLTPLECERLQGFPDNWTEGISDTQRYKCIGNAVSVPVVEYILKQMEKTIGNC